MYDITPEEHLLLDLYADVFEKEYDQNAVAEYNALIAKIEEGNKVYLTKDNEEHLEFNSI